MNGPTLSVLGLYQYDDSLFDNLNLPTGVSKEDVCDNILMECAELEVFLTNFDVFKSAIGYWSRAMLPKWNRINSVLNQDYNPLENYDRQEYWEDNLESNNTNNTNSVADSTVNSHGTSGSENELTVAGFNAETYTNREKNTTMSESTDGSASHGQGTTAAAGHYESGSDHRGRAHGNIGVTTSQQMLTSEVEVAKNFQIINIIVGDFKERFCLCVY